MPLSPSHTLVLLLCGLRAGAADVPEPEVRALVGGHAELNCSLPQPASFDLSDLYVYWQVSVAGQPQKVAFHLGNGSRGVERQYRHRARLPPERLRRGDFSLSLRGVSPLDARTFHCLVFQKSLGMGSLVDTKVALRVAANYSVPVVRGPSRDGAFTFTCTSGNGYPRPNVYWINRTDNSLLDAALYNSSVTQNAQGLYDVVSILRLGRATSADIGCCIENVLLRQNLTVSSRADTHVAEESQHTEGPRPGPSGSPLAVSALAAAVAVAVAVAAGVAAGCVCRGRRLRKRFAGHV